MSAPVQHVARNAACPCGSGRRFKACCGNSALPPMAASAESLADRLRRALALQESGSLAEAEVAYREVLQRDPDLADAVHMLGVIHLQSGNHAQALRRLRQAAELFHWELPAVRHNLGLALSALLAGRNGTQLERLWAAYDGWRDRLRAGRRDVDPRVSVVVAGFDRTASEAMLESVFRQSYAPLEIIVVGDHALDELRRMLARSPNPWRVLDRRDRGITAAINDAVAQSTGDFVNVLAGDDRFAATRVEAMVEAIARAGAAWGFSRAEVVGSGGAESTPEARARASELAYAAADVAACDTVGVSFLSGNPAGSLSALFFSRSLFDELGGFREHASCYDFCLRAAIAAEPVYVPSAEYEQRLPAAGSAAPEEQAARRAAEAAFASFYDVAIATRQPANPFAPVPAVWGERFFAQVLAQGHAASLAAPVLRDMAVRVAAACNATPG